jgi:hypothetical protein
MALLASKLHKCFDIDHITTTHPPLEAAHLSQGPVSSWLYCQKPRGHLLQSICLCIASNWPQQPSVQKAFQRCANRTLTFDIVCMHQPHSIARNSVDPQLMSWAAVLCLLYSGEAVMMRIVLLPCCFVSAKW